MASRGPIRCCANHPSLVMMSQHTSRLDPSRSRGDFGSEKFRAKPGHKFWISISSVPRLIVADPRILCVAHIVPSGFQRLIQTSQILDGHGVVRIAVENSHGCFADSCSYLRIAFGVVWIAIFCKHRLGFQDICRRNDSSADRSVSHRPLVARTPYATNRLGGAGCVH